MAENKSVCLVDLVLQFGSVTSFLNIDASYTILDLVKNLKRIDPLFLDGSLVKHASGIRVLAEPFYAEDARRITPADIDEILDVLSQSFDFVVVDTPKEFDDMLALVLDKANLILFITEMDVPSLKSAHRAFELFERMGIYDKKIRLILNRYVKSKLMTLESVEKALGRQSVLDAAEQLSGRHRGGKSRVVDPRMRREVRYRQELCGADRCRFKYFYCVLELREQNTKTKRNPAFSVVCCRRFVA